VKPYIEYNSSDKLQIALRVRAKGHYYCVCVPISSGYSHSAEKADITNRPLNIYIDSWHAWQPCASLPALSISASGGRREQCEVDKPNLAGVPAMARRRLSPLARVVFHVLDQCANTGTQEPVVFSSFMGEIQRTQGLLNAIGSDQPVSPAAFSLSVHNAIAGQWSLIHGIKAPMVAISPPCGSCVAALLEAAGILQEKHYQSVNIVFYEEDYPAFYAPYLDGPRAPAALALRLISAEQAGPHTQHFSLHSTDALHRDKRNSDPLELLPLLEGSCTSLHIAEPKTGWRLDLVAQ